MNTTREQREHYKENNPTLRLSERTRKFLAMYVEGWDPYESIARIWPLEKNKAFKFARILRDENFQVALKFLTEPQLTRHALAYRQLLVAGECEKPIDKVHAIRAASQILGHIRNGQGESSNVTRKTQKNKIPATPPSELELKMDELLKKAKDHGHPTEKTN